MLNQDSSLKGHADRDLGIDIDRFEAGNKVSDRSLAISCQNGFRVLVQSWNKGCSDLMVKRLLHKFKKKLQSKNEPYYLKD